MIYDVYEHTPRRDTWLGQVTATSAFVALDLAYQQFGYSGDLRVFRTAIDECRDPGACASKSYCPLDPTCGE